MIWYEKFSITLPLAANLYHGDGQDIENPPKKMVEFSLFMAILDYQMVAGIDLMMVVSRTCHLKTLKLGPFYFQLNFSQPKWRMGWEYQYIQLFRELGWISSAIGLISSGRGEIWWNLTQQSATIITPNLPVSGFSWVFYRNVFGPNICGDVDDFLPARRQGVRISCLHWRR